VEALQAQQRPPDLQEESSSSFSSKAMPCMKACGLIQACPEDVFKLIMDLSPSRTQWDLTFNTGKVLHRESRRSDVVHLALRPVWLFPLWADARDFVMSRHWKQEEDGAYTIIYSSVHHASCPKLSGVQRADLKGACVVIVPYPQEDGTVFSVVTHAMEVDIKGYVMPKLHKGLLAGGVALVAISLQYSYLGLCILVVLSLLLWAASATFQKLLGKDGISKLSNGFNRAYMMEMLMSLAGLRDMIVQVPELEAFILDTGIMTELNASDQIKSDNGRAPDAGFNSDQSDDDDDLGGPPGSTPRKPPASPKSSLPAKTCMAEPAGGGVKKMDEQQIGDIKARFRNDVMPILSKLATEHCTMRRGEGTATQCYQSRDVEGFVVRGKNYLHDKVKVPATSTLMELVGCDLTGHQNSEHLANLGQHPHSFAKKVLDTDWSTFGELEPFLFMVHFQVPGTPMYSTVIYFATPKCLLGASPGQTVLMNYFNGTQEYCDARLKLIPNVAEGSWIVRKGVGNTPAILGSKLKMTYFKGPNYFEVDIDTGVSSMAGAIVGLVQGPAKTLVIDLAFLVEAKSGEELPEELIGVVRLRKVDLGLIANTRTVFRET